MGETLLIHELILDGEFALVCNTQTWMGEGDDINLALICPPGFRVHLPRAGGQAGEVAVVYCNNIVLPRKPVQHQSGLECLY